MGEPIGNKNNVIQLEAYRNQITQDEKDIKNMLHYLIVAYELEPAGDISYLIEQIVEKKELSRAHLERVDREIRINDNEKPLVD